MLIILASVGLTATATLTPLEQTAARHVALEYERVGRNTPIVDPVLSQAARTLAEKALNGALSDAADLITQIDAISNAGGHDANPRTLLVRATPAREAVQAFLQRSDFNDEPASHLGVGMASRNGFGALAILLADRKAQLDPLPRAMARATHQSLCGRLEPTLHRPELFVTRPNGRVERFSAKQAAHGRFCFRVPFAADGRHVVELLARGEQGPEVAALFFARVGKPDDAGRDAQPTEPKDIEEARALITGKINSLRKSHQLIPLARDPVLDQVAQAYAARMARERFFAHIAPDGSDLRSRLQAGGHRYLSAGENLGLASGPLAAHFGIEHSPGHRKNLMEPTHTHLGIGIAERQSGAHRETIVVEILSHPAAGTADPLESAYRSLEQRRTRQKMPPLFRHAQLEQIARAHLEAAIRLGEPKTQLPGRNLHDAVFSALPEAVSAAADFFIADEAALVADSKNVLAPSNSMVGIALTRHDSPRFGRGRYWVVVVYAAVQ